MRITIFHKLFFTFLLTSIIMMSGMAVMINQSFQKGLQSYINEVELDQVERLAEMAGRHYVQQNGWLSRRGMGALWADMLMQIGELPPPKMIPPGSDMPPLVNRIESLTTRVTLVDDQGVRIIGSSDNLTASTKNEQITKVPIIVAEQTVGWIVLKQFEKIHNRIAEGFFHEQMENFYWIAAWTALFSFIVAAFTVRYFLKPLKRLNSGAKALTDGEYQHRIEARGNDELSELAQVFNQLAGTLNYQQQMRQQWLADISHELRTPIAVLRSEIEALMDGIRKAEPRYIESLHNQVINLSKLVNDLYQLSLSDAGLFIEPDKKLNLTQILNDVVTRSATRFEKNHITISRLYDGFQSVEIIGDQQRIEQLLTNLFENSYRYTDKDGQVNVTLARKNEQVQLTIEDSTPAVPDEALPKIFDRLYRVDKSRSRASGGSGLGLAICRDIVTAHHGVISAHHSQLGGLRIEITLPVKGM